MTLDTNCIIDLENNGPEADHIKTLIHMHKDQKINLRIVAVSASEQKRDRTYASNFGEFRDRVASIGLGAAGILKPIAYWDISFWDWCVWADDEMVDLEKRIHVILFPNIEFSYREFCVKRGFDPDDGEMDSKWRNAKCDVLCLWSHIWYGGGVFVTSDNNFHGATKKSALLSLGVGKISRPTEAVTRLRAGSY